jgi:uncharacterized protein
MVKVMSLTQLSQQLQSQKLGKGNNIPPVELWDPAYCGEIDLRINADGTWYYQGTPFRRLSLVKLFASVLKKEAGDYFLVTPVEKVKIQVEDAPFILTNWHWQTAEQTCMQVTTNMEDQFELNAQHPLLLTEQGLYVTVRRNLLAKVHRNVYYQWVALAHDRETEHGTELVFFSAGHPFSLGKLSD